MKNYGIILASGIGNRYGSDVPKQFIKIAGKTVFEHTIEIFIIQEKYLEQKIGDVQKYQVVIFVMGWVWKSIFDFLKIIVRLFISRDPLKYIVRIQRNIKMKKGDCK